MQVHIPEQWPICQNSSDYLDRLYDANYDKSVTLGVMENKLRMFAGVDLRNIVDHWVLPDSYGIDEELTNAGFTPKFIDGTEVWGNWQAQLPEILLSTEIKEPQIAIRVDNIDRFIPKNDLRLETVAGDIHGGLRLAHCRSSADELCEDKVIVLSRFGYAGYKPQMSNLELDTAIEDCRNQFVRRNRIGDEGDVIRSLADLFDHAAELIGNDRAVDLFFETERHFYVKRNLAARNQLDFQNQCGIGWANHDHHTYRSSRRAFKSLMNLWLKMGFYAREKFYAGDQAGWGAQVLEHPVSRIVLFCDVDLSPDELAIDFAEVELQDRIELGTIGLWCGLHGSSIASAGLHHLECELDFDECSERQAEKGIKTMPPFTDLPHLKQAFTQAEIWKVEESRLLKLLEDGSITEEQANRFRENGAPGSHFEILQRRFGFKGFNKTGVSSIIRDTDARSLG